MIKVAPNEFDKGLNDIREARWMKAFSDGCALDEDIFYRFNIVIENVVQASDVLYMMQH